MTQGPPPYDLIAAELCRLAQADGAELWRNRIRLTGLLLDAQPDLRREIRAVVSGVEQGVAAALSDTERSLSGIAIDRQANLLETESGLRPEIALNVARTIAHALNLGPLPSVYGHARAAPPPSPLPPRAYAPVAHGPQPQPVPPPIPPRTWSDPRGEPPQSGYDSSSSRSTFPWVPVVIGSAVLIGGGVLTATLLPRAGSNTSASRTPTPTPTPAPTPTPTPTPPPAGASMQPGQWESVATPTGLEAPGATPEMLAQMRARLTTQRQSECVTAATSQLTGQNLMTSFAQGMGQGTTCNVLRSNVGNGTIDATGTCRAPAFNMNLAMRGTYTPTNLSFDTDATLNTGQQIITVSYNTVSRRVGDCS